MLIVTRLFLGHLPDKLVGAKVALLFAVAQPAGLLLIGLASSSLASLGYSLVYPGLGAEAVRLTPSEDRGLAMGIYKAFLDLAMAIGSPLLGYAAGHLGLSAVFVVSAAIALGAVVVAVTLMRT